MTGRTHCFIVTRRIMAQRTIIRQSLRWPIMLSLIHIFIELQYSTDVNGNPFRATFENLDSVDVQGVWNQAAKRIEF